MNDLAGKDARPAAVLIAGPTASGKSALALELAERVGGAVINADSMQVYSGLHVLTARPDADETARAPHLLYGHGRSARALLGRRYIADARVALESCAERGLVPIFTGGTGLYFKALLEGVSPIPPVREETRARWDARLEEEGIEALRALLASVDPQLCARHPRLDAQRLVRALSVHDETGRALSAWQAVPGTPVIAQPGSACVFLDPDRDWLRARIDARFEKMVREGALEEVRALVGSLRDASLPARRAHGVPHLAACLAGELSLEEAIARGQADTRRYAKRQRTWFRHQMPGWQVLDPCNEKARERWLAGFGG